MAKKIAVAGGGAAGMMAAVAAASKGAQVTLYERNEKLGKKIYITGKGRCNVTNACDREDFLTNVVSNPRFLYSAFYHFDNEAVQRFFIENGCPLKVERGDRVFPVSDHSSDITRTLEREMLRYGVKIHLNTKVEKIITKQMHADACPNEKAAQQEKICGIQLSDGSKAEADAVILATGGLSYPVTGSDGMGLKMAEALGHTITSTSPSLVPFAAKEEWCQSLQGLALKNVGVSLTLDKKEIYTGFGEMLFTHFGVSGPLILSASSYYSAALDARHKKEEKKGLPKTTPEAELFINLKPALTEEQLDKRLLRDFEENKNRAFKNAIGGLFPARLIPVMIALSGIDPDKKVNEITREERKNFVSLIGRVPLTITGTRGYAEAIITRGGVKVSEVNPSTMESKKVKGLYLTGEMLDVDALTGGFNLQIAWSTGYLAGESAAEGGKL